ncbi:hypothetical protein SNE25_05965 [Mucilaginibacter sabulilitoris]|uniref:Nuclear transport factor 2 family protein n=1 Tax=Mucilaginibacter sabulilitoris TaxID=1173583 RepID=A0ABZ0TPJ8_9SPHI|nr:hypothetical protein [Mucilaginibacter sabulilitoris]WPU95069.1 hypothetical protein SNE25_05965 [Mucilaginibacter sabulilitoris]
METLKQKVEAFNKLITADETVKAMELYYAGDVALQENEEAPRGGKQACMAREIALLAKFDLIIEITRQAIDEAGGVVFSEYMMTITDKSNGNVMHRKEISVQQWENGLIKTEKFYYNQAALL